MLLKRRGLNFLTEDHEQNLDMESIEKIEKEVDNVAPKIVGILGLSESSDTQALREQMVEYCCQYMQGLKGKEEIEIDKESQFQAFICPNAGNNMNSRK